MKRKIATILLATMLLSNLVGCAKAQKVVNTHGDEVYKYGRFIEIENSKEVFRDEESLSHTQKLVYDETTKIIYIYEKYHYSVSVSISPFYCVNENDEAVIALSTMGEED